jgi:alanyl-tRNA synthetase
MDAGSIRGSYTKFFEARGHLEVASAPLVAPGDPTLLFTSAGMVPFKPYFLQQAQPPQSRLTSIQKCFRTTDIDEVGDDSHLTFFEMMGNFSFGDYFKEEAQAWAWELVTKELQVPADRLVTTVFTDDDDAFDLWRKLGVPERRIFRYGADQGNYWYAGEDGPCGPCSEIHYDMQPDPRAPDAGPADDEARFLEIWNLVFMQFQQNKDGSKTPLPAQNIDTGAGLERWAMMLQGKDNLYATDLFLPLLEYVAGRCDRDYHRATSADQRALRVVVEHGRAMTFLVSDGVLPSNEGRGYVLRRLVRRALYMAHTLGIEDDVLVDVASEVRRQMSDWYPQVVEQAALVDGVLQQEEERFRRTLATGQSLLEEQILPAVRSGKSVSLPGLEVQAAGSKTNELGGDAAFVLWDTYGFPPDLTREIAEQAGLQFDQAGFDAAMEAQRERGRAAATFRHGEDAAVFAAIDGVSAFSGYDQVEDRGRVLGIVVDGAQVDRAEAGTEVEVVLDRTSFYPEGGGQMGDAGVLTGPDGRVAVRDTQSRGDLISHIGEVSEGAIGVTDELQASVDRARRHDLMRNHTGTHLLHAALRYVLGDHVRQAGSLVAPERLRFDYTQPEGPTSAQLADVQRLINAKIREDITVGGTEMPYDEALQSGAVAIFGEKYGTAVRVVEICDPDPAVHDCFSKELCGGVHVPATGFIGGLQIVSEGSVGAGVRRIEALTGAAAEAWQQERLAVLNAIAESTKSTAMEAGERVRALQAELETSRRRLAERERESGASSAAALADEAIDVDGVAVVAGRVEVESADALRQAGDEVRKRLGSGVIVLGAVSQDRPVFVAMVSDDLVASGLHAGKLIKQVASVAGGGGGGKPTMAQAGAKDASKLDAALAVVADVVRQQHGG